METPEIDPKTVVRTGTSAFNVAKTKSNTINENRRAILEQSIVPMEASFDQNQDFMTFDEDEESLGQGKNNEEDAETQETFREI